MLTLIPIVLYLFAMLGIAWKVNEIKHSEMSILQRNII